MSAPWNLGDTTPPAPGIYERNYTTDAAPYPLMARWNGAEWFIGCSDRAHAKRTEKVSRCPFLPWREIP